MTNTNTNTNTTNTANTNYKIVFAWVNDKRDTYYERFEMSKGNTLSIALPTGSRVWEVSLYHEGVGIFGIGANETTKTACDCNGKYITLSYINSVLSVLSV